MVMRGVAKRFGDRPIFENVDLELGEGEKVALLGANGSGKSTLLRLLAGLERPDAGSIAASGSVALLAQTSDLREGTVLEVVTPEILRAARRVFEMAGANLADPTEAHLEAFSRAEEHYRACGGYDFEVRAAGVLAGLGLRPEWRARTLSGGQGRRVSLAALLLFPADVLLLDEPTNHLDAASIAWLEGWVRASKSAVLIVSHDRAFLDGAVSRVCELERGELHSYPGNYTAAMEIKRTLREARVRLHEARERQRGALTDEMHRRQSKARSANAYNPKRASDGDKMLAKGKAQNAQNVNAGRARAIEKRLERLEVVEKPFEDRAVVQVPLGDVPSGPVEVLRVRNLTLARGGNTLFEGLSFTLRRGEKLALTGPNGSGKSSLIAAVLGQLPLTAGDITPGHGLTTYWAGQHGEELANFVTLEDAIRDAQPVLRTQDLYYLLSQLGLPPRPNFPLADLSGGQRTRLSLARLAVTRAALLVLDEPTNHLDVRAIEALETLLSGYPGTLLFASHDRCLIARVATRTLPLGELTPGEGTPLNEGQQ